MNDDKHQHWHDIEADYDDLHGLHDEGQGGAGWELLITVVVGLFLYMLFGA